VPLLYTIGMLTVGPAVRLAIRPTIEGIEHLSEVSGAVLAGNHLSVADEYLMGSVVPRHIAFWAKAVNLACHRSVT
jgi:1-acyl-sn-glycerol-3-phosphate acyltransferase